ncbi:hypothetical protein [Sphingosinicella xenopeptidilytica]|uniref:Minor tail protein n=1 Tax=Sphingosinicella xenopeptidilytica TaxID=364098 RepID=A0ABW3C3U4_SPHXN
MAFGIKVWNDYGSVLIDDQAPVYGVVAEGSATTVSPTTQIGASSFSISYTGSADSAPIVAIRPSLLSSIIGASRSSNTWTWTFNSALSIGATVPWWVFDRPDPPAEDYGIKIFDAAGNVTYYTAQKPLRIRDVIEYDGDAPGGLTYDTGRLYAGGFITGCGQSNRIASGPGLFTLRVFSLGVRDTGAGTIQVAHHQHSQGSPAPAPGAGVVDLWEGALLVLDVTDF